MSVFISSNARRAARLRLALLVGSVCAVSLVGASVAYGSSLTSLAAGRAAKRAAVRHVAHLGLSYPYSQWTAFCLQWQRGSYSCTVATRGMQCHGRLVVYGSARRPRTRGRHISCQGGLLAASPSAATSENSPQADTISASPGPAVSTSGISD